MKTLNYTLLVLILTLTAACKDSPWHVHSSNAKISIREFDTMPVVTPTTMAANPLPSSLDVVFPDEVNMASVSAEDLVLTSTGNCPYSPLLSLNKTSQLLRVFVDNSTCSNGDSIKLMVRMSGVMNKQGRRGKGFMESTYTLNVQSAPAPTLSLVSGTVNVFPESFDMTFEDSIDMNSVTPSAISINGGGNCPVSPLTGMTQSGNTVTVVYDTAGCSDGDSISIQIDNTQILDLDGRNGIGSISRELTLDTSGPSLSDVTLDQPSGDTNPLPVSLVLSLPSDINMDSVSLSDFSLSGSGSCNGTVLQSISKDNQEVTLHLDTTNCQHGDSVDFLLSLNSILDLAGNAGSGDLSASWRLVTALPSSPAWSTSGGNFASLPTAIELQFSDSTDMNSVLSDGLSLSSTGTCPVQNLAGAVISDHKINIPFSTSGCSHGDSITVNVDMTGISNTVGLFGTGSVSKTFELDTHGPTNPLINIESGTFAELPGDIFLQFDETTDMTTVDSTSLVATGTGTCPANPFSSLSIVGQSATVTLNPTGCSDGDVIEFKIIMSLVKDTLGNAGGVDIIKTFILDNSLPAAPTLSIPSGSVAALPAALQFNFDPDINMATVTESAFTIIGTGNCPINPVSTFTISGSVVEVLFITSGCRHNDALSLVLDMSTIQNSLGNAGSGSFSTMYVLDTEGPAAPSISLASSTVSVMPLGLAFTFSADTSMATVTQSDFSLNGSGSCLGSSITNFTKTGTQVTLALDTTPCQDGESLSVSVNMSGVSDSLGNIGSGLAQSTFILDNVGPLLPSVNLQSQTLSTLPASLIYTFPTDTDMNTVSAADFSGSGTGTCPGNPVTGISKSGFVVTVSLSGVGCGQGDGISAFVSMSGITDALGNSGVGSLARTFTLDSVGPANAILAPVSATLNSLPTSVTATFSSDTDMATVTSGVFTVSGTGTCATNPLTGISKSGQVATLQINVSSCTHGSTLNVSLNMAQVMDPVGNPGAGILTRTFTLDTVGPANPSVSAVGGSFITMPSSVTFTFASDVDMTTVDASDFSSVSTGLCSPTAITGFSKSGQTATISLNPNSCILNSTIKLDLNMGGVKDLTGNAGAGVFSNTYKKII